MSSSTHITHRNLVEQLQSTVPDFSINPDWLEGVLGYPIINDLARFICDRAEVGDFEQVRSAMRFFEMGIEDGDEYVRDLVLEALETLSACQHIPAVRKYFGPRLLDLWRTILTDFE
jgi:hypothetical protein